MQTSTVVYIVDDDAAVGRAIRVAIATMLKLPVQAFSSAEQFLEGYDPDQPGCLLLDITLPGMNGLELLETLRAKGVELPVVMISGDVQVRTAVASVKAGALNVLEKPFDFDELRQQVEIALEIDAHQRSMAGRKNEVKLRLASLTEREREVMSYMMDGLSSKEIANTLGTSVPTADKHRWKVLSKMHADSAIELIKLMHGIGA